MQKKWIILDCHKAQLKAAMNSEAELYNFIKGSMMPYIKANPHRWIVIKPEARYNPFAHIETFIEDYERELKMKASD